MQSTLRPQSAAEVAEAIRWAISAREPLEVIGGGTKRAISMPTQAAHTLDVSAVAGIAVYEPEELVLTLAPGTLLRTVSAALDEAGQMLAFEPPDYTALLGARGEATFGGTFGTNFAGPRRLSAGAVRDHLLGLVAVSGRGEPFKAGGRVVKNVTGYDLARALTGSWGTLAVATELTIKVLPRPEGEATLALLGLDPPAAVAAMARAMGSSAEVSGAAHLPGDIASLVHTNASAAHTMLRVEGFGPSVAARLKTLKDMFHDMDIVVLEDDASALLWRTVRDAAAFVGTNGVVWRCSVPPMSGPDIVAAAPAGSRWYLDWAGGLAMIEAPETGDGGAAAIRSAIAQCGGHATMLRAPVDLRAAVPTFHPMSGGVAALGARLRAQFDPHDVLNRNRMARQPQ